MALTAYTRVKLFWGALTAESGYSTAQSVSLGSSAVAVGGIGVRRVQLVFSRLAPATYSEDTAIMHFDFANYTAGSPDDSWITGDFTTLESALTTMWGSLKPICNLNLSLREYRWYRIGSGVTPPNPAVRVTPVGQVAIASGNCLPPQVAISITNKTGLRKRWGRTYLPDIDSTALESTGRILSAKVDVVAGAVNTMYAAAAAADFMPVVYSPTAAAAYAIENTQVDNIFDVIRRRRWDSTTYRKSYP